MNRLMKLTLLPMAFATTLTLMNAQTRPADTTNSNDAVAQAIEMNSAEIDLAKVAASKAQDPKVKAFADMMVKDHTQALTKLQALGGSSNATPNSKHRDTASQLSKLSGSEFDRDFMATMVSDHQEALAFFEMQSKTGNSTNGMAKVSQELVLTVRKHLNDAEKIQKELAKSETKSANPSQPGNNTYSQTGTVPNNSGPRPAGNGGNAGGGNAPGGGGGGNQ